MTPLRRLMTTLDRACPLGQIRGGVVTSNGHSALVGLATESDSHRYQWDGLRRGGNPASPFLTIQYTLDGWGSFTQDGPAQRVGPGQAFIATTPGPYRYGLPPEAPPWTFAWMLFYLPYAIARLDREAGERGRVVSLPPDGPAMGAFARLFLTVARSTGRMDPWEFERQVLDMTLHWSRHLAQVEAHAGPDLTAQVDAHLERHPERFIPVAELAASAGLSRQRWSTRFRAATGTTPAAYVMRWRIHRACNALRSGDDELADIARACGFSDANHLCKVFRRHLGITPGSLRQGG